MNDWTTLLTAAFSGGVAVKLLDYGVDWIKSRHHAKKTAEDVVNAHLDPLLKAADEIVGKTRSLAERDFVPLVHDDSTNATEGINPHLMGLMYLYAKFWSRIEILERDALAVSIANDKRGLQLKRFLACLGSQRIRLVDRVHQKAIGEITTKVLENGALRTIGVVEFTDRVLNDETAKSWIAPLHVLLKNVHIKARRQRLLVYGVVIHALIDELDPAHHTTHPRPTYPHKLSKESKRGIKHRVFKVYLEKDKGFERYINDK